MKKLLSALLVLALLFSLASCGLTQGQNPEPPAQEGVSQSNEQEIPEESPGQPPETPGQSQEEPPAEQEKADTPEEPEKQEEPEGSSEPAQTQKPAENPTGESAQNPSEDPGEEPSEEPSGEPIEEPSEEPSEEPIEEPTEEPAEDPTGETESAPYSYTGKDEVAAYIHTYGCLPDNFMTKSEARAIGWRSGSLEKYAPGMCIGGDRFYNREGLLPEAPGRYYYECDIDTLGKSSRGAKRIVFSNDGLIYYTDDHYNSFTLLYGEP